MESETALGPALGSALPQLWETTSGLAWGLASVTGLPLPALASVLALALGWAKAWAKVSAKLSAKASVAELE